MSSMTFNEKIADYVLGNRTRTQYPNIALSALEEDLESESLLIICGMTEEDNSYELEQYFNNMLGELEVQLPTKLEAANTLISYYLNKMIAEPRMGFSIMTKIQNEIYYAEEWEQLIPETEKMFVGQELGLQHMYTWYRELQDQEDGSRLFYHNDLPKRKFEENLVDEAKKWLKINAE